MSHLLTAERGQISRAAEALKCQPSFLSRVMSAEIHLTLDHAFLLTKFLKLDSDESEYFRALVEHERASDPLYKDSLAAKLAELKKRFESLQRRTQKENFSVAHQEGVYFSSWIWSALHFLTSIPEFQSAKAIASRLGLREEVVQTYLKQLESFGLVRQNKSKWEYAGGQFHLPKNSPFVVLHHQNWRSRAVLDAQNFDAESVHYTSVLTLSKADAERLKVLLLGFISESEKVARPSPPEESLVLNCDLFKA